MTKQGKMKLGLGVLAAVAAITVAVVSTSGALFQGKMALVTKANADLNSAITRCELMKVLVVAAEFTVYTPSTPTFKDVPTTSWCYPYVETMVKQGLVQGSADGNFNPLDKVNRAEVAKIVVTTFGLPQFSPKLQTFKDVKNTTWYYTYIESLYANIGIKICNNENYCVNNNYFAPSRPAFKGWTVAVINSMTP